MTDQVSSEAYKSVPSVQAVEPQQELRRKRAIGQERQRGNLASRMRKAFSDCPAQYLMRFQDFQNPKRRNKILQEYGLEPIHLPFDPVPLKRPRKRRFGPKNGKGRSARGGDTRGAGNPASL
jgi:hypothetical protein